jgi:hypothetical protein
VPDSLLKKAKEILNPGDLEPLLPQQCLIIHNYTLFSRGGDEKEDSIVPGFIDNLYLLNFVDTSRTLTYQGIALETIVYKDKDYNYKGELVDFYLLRSTLDMQEFTTGNDYRVFVEGK